MKWNMLVASLVLSVGLCSQSYGFELLDRMLGYGCGCEPSCCVTANSCCDPCNRCCKPRRCCKPACDPCARQACPATCGCEVAAHNNCGCDPCAKSCCKKSCCHSLFGGLFSHRCCKPRCCDPCANTCGYENNCGYAAHNNCGCEPACGHAHNGCGCDPCANSCCKSRCRRHCFFSNLFSCRRCCSKPACHNNCGCGVPADCGCGGEVYHNGANGHHNGDVDALPPAPVVDPSAFVPSKRRVVHASTTGVAR